MTNKKVQKYIWLLLAIITIGNGIITLTVYNQSTLSIYAGTMQILGGIFLLILTYMVFKKKEDGKSN